MSEPAQNQDDGGCLGCLAAIVIVFVLAIAVKLFWKLFVWI